MATHKLPWRDALRLLRKRQDFVSDLSERTVADSIQAFLAWKAFIIVARGTTPSAKEKNQCQELLRITLLEHSQVRAPARAFIRGLEALGKQTDALLHDWYCEEDSEPQEKSRRTDQARRRIRNLIAARDADRLTDAKAAYDLGEDMYAVRSAVIAHASVQTSGNLFPHIVPPFGDLAALAACAGIAVRAMRPLSEVLEEAHVSS